MGVKLLEKAAKTEDEPSEDRREAVLAELVAFLKARRYEFVTGTPATHARVLARRGDGLARDLRDIFGWSMPFPGSLLEPTLLARLAEAGIVVESAKGLRSQVRVSSLGGDLFIHSAYPTESADAVFFGPDSYRFASLIAQQLGLRSLAPGARVVDMGTGAGVGAIVAARLCASAKIAMTDINPAALMLAQINARLAQVEATAYLAADLSPVQGPIDLVLANPPYIEDEAGRTYRHGGGMQGAAVSLDMAREAVPRLAPGGRLILYTGSAIIGGNDALRDSLVSLAEDHGCALRYSEIDPDVFGEELETEAYRQVERIAVVSAIIERPGAAE